MAICSISTLATDGKNFQRCSDQDILVCIAQLLCDIAAAGGGSQTPWTSDIDGAGFDLTNAGAIDGNSVNVSGALSGASLSVGSLATGGFIAASGTVTNNLNVGMLNGVKVYRAILTQSGTDAPVAAVLKNSLGGTVVWTRDGEGIYTATLSNAFTESKTLAESPSAYAPGPDVRRLTAWNYGGQPDALQLRSADPPTDLSADLSGTVAVLILVYP